MTQIAKRPGQEERMDSRERPEFSPAVDIYDSGEEIVLVADMPGVPAENLDINLDKGVLTLRGRVTPPEVQGHLVFEEYRLGDFVRTFAVTEDVDSTAIAAELKNGVLTLRLPKAAERKPRKIVVNGG